MADLLLKIMAYAGAAFVVFGSWSIPYLVAGWWPKQFALRHRNTQPLDSPDWAEASRIEQIEYGAYWESGKTVGIVVMLVVDALLLWFWFTFGQ